MNTDEELAYQSDSICSPPISRPSTSLSIRQPFIDLTNAESPISSTRNSCLQLNESNPDVGDDDDDGDDDGVQFVHSENSDKRVPKKKSKTIIPFSDPKWSSGVPVAGKYSYLFHHALYDGRASNCHRCNLCGFICENGPTAATYMKRHRQKHIGAELIPKLEYEVQQKQLFAAIKGRSFLSFDDKELVELLDSYGKLSVACKEANIPCEVEKVLLSRRQLSNKVKEKIHSGDLSNKFSELVELVRKRGAITFDFGHNVHDYLAITAHVVTDDACPCLKPFVLVFHQWKEKRKTREVIGQQICKMLQNVQLTDSEMFNLGTVTDEGANVVNAFGNELFRLRCCCHIINTIAKRSLDPYEEIEDPQRQQMFQILESIKGVELFVREARKIPLIVEKCGSDLTEPVETRWLSKLRMARVFMNSRQHIIKILDEMRNDDCDFMVNNKTTITLFRNLCNNDIFNISAFVEVLAPLERAMPSLESAKTPTINKIVRTFAEFEIHWQKFIDEYTPEAPESIVGKAAIYAFQKKFTNSFNIRLLKAATFLDPSELLRINGICRKVKRWGTLGSFKDATLTLFHGSGISMDVQEESESGRDELFPCESVAPDVELEIGAYMRQQVNSSEEFNVLAYWNGAGRGFPLLRQLALKILSIPCSIAHSERAFSRLRYIYNNYRRSLSSNTISSLICLGSLQFEDLYD